MEHEERLKAALADRYQIERAIGSGGMATVYLAQDLKHDRKVAVKVLDPDLAQSLGAERFLKEIKTAANLTHPHILPVFDSGEAAGFLFYVMPYVKGESLRTRLTKERQLPVEDAIQITREIADALAYAHDEGVIHRDVKPANIMLEAGYAVLADFGVAHAVAEAKDERITRTGTSLGTPAYMSPEQATGEQDLDGRSDQYALGCVLYEMLAGHPPFTGAQVEAVVRQHLSAEPPSVTHTRPAVADEVVKVIHRALAKSPADRFRTTGEMAAALALTTALVPSPKPSTARSIWVPAWVAVAVTLIGVGVWSWLGNEASQVLEPGQMNRLTFDPGLEIDPAISPDGKWVAFVSGSFGSMHVHLRQVSGGRAVDLTDGLPGDHRWPKWSPDGEQIMFQAGGPSPIGGAIYLIPALGGLPRKIVEHPSTGLVERIDFIAAGSANWSPDGSQIAYIAGESIFIASSDGTGARELGADYQPHSVDWSPDGSRLVYVSGNNLYVLGTTLLANGATSAIRVLSLSDGSVVTLTDQEGVYQSPLWLPSSDRLLYISNEGGARDVYEVQLSSSGAPTGPPTRLTTNLGALTISLTGDARRLAYSTFRNDANIWSVPIPTRGTSSVADAMALTTGNQAIEGIGISPDGQWLVFDSNRRGNADIYRLALADGHVEQLTDHPADDFIPSWSPDGNEIAFYSFRHGTRDLFVMAADGAAETRLTNDPSQERYPDWSPDGNSLVFRGDKTGEDEIWLMSREDRSSSWGEPRQLTSDGGFSPRWSPDGQWIAYVGSGTLRLISPDGGPPLLLAEGRTDIGDWVPVFPEWSSDSRTVFFKAHDVRGNASFWSVPVTGGVPRMLVRLDDPMSPSLRPEFTTDGERFFFTIGKQESDIWVMDLLTG
jgi:serine/threonine-protein kinase